MQLESTPVSLSLSLALYVTCVIECAIEMLAPLPLSLFLFPLVVLTLSLVINHFVEQQKVPLSLSQILKIFALFLTF